MIDSAHMENRRILFVVPLPPPVHGSSVVSIQIKDSKLINETFKCDFVNMATSRSMSEIGKPSFLKIFRFLGSYLKLLSKLITHKYDLCYLAIACFGAPFLKDAPFVLLCKLFCKNIVIHQHNRGMSEHVDKPIFRRIYPLVYKNVKVILLSWHLYDDVKKIVDRNDVFICPNGIKPIENTIIQRTLNQTPRILFLSNMLVDKGVLVFLDALAIAKRRSCKFSCDLIGRESADLNSSKITTAISERGITGNVFYRGAKYGEEKNQLFESTDIFVLPSYNEAFPLVILEAMQHSKPVVSTYVGGIPDQVMNGDNGFLVKPRDAEALADSIEILLKDKSLRKKMGVRGHQLYLEKFTDEIFEKNICTILNSCINE